MNQSRFAIVTPLLPVAAMLLFAACSRPTNQGYPSLAPRPIEKTSFADPVAPPAAAVVADPALDTAIATTAAQLDAVAKGFAADAAKAEAAARAAKGQAAGSDKWLDAQTALGALDQWHAQLSSLSTDTEEQAIARAAALAPAYPPLDELQARITRENDAEAATLARLQAALAPA